MSDDDLRNDKVIWDKFALMNSFSLGNMRMGSDEVKFLNRRLETLEMHMGLSNDNTDNCLFVGNLDNTRDADYLRMSVLHYFSQLGSVTSVRINRDNSNRPYALVYFVHASQASSILKQSKSIVLDGRHLRVEKSRTNCSLFIDSIPTELNAAEVRGILAQFGSIREFNMLGAAFSQLPHNLAYVTYTCRTSAIFALSQIKRMTSWNADLKIESTPIAYDHRSIYVGRLNPECVSSKLLVERFKKYGTIGHLLILVHPNQNLACAYIKFSTPASCYAAVRAENGAEWQGCTLRVEMKRNES